MAKKMSKEELKAKLMATKAIKKEEEKTMESKKATATEEMVIVSKAAMDSAIEAEEKAAKAAEAAQKKAAKWAKEEAKLEGAKLDDNGKFQIIVDPDLENRGDHKSWTPYAWLVTEGFKKVRLAWKFALELADQGKAVEVSKEQTAEGKKSIKKQSEAIDSDSSFEEILHLIPSAEDFVG